MTYALTSAGLWVNRANTAYGASRQYNVGSSFETDSATWHGRADSAWGASRVWSSGSSFETDSSTWHGRADSAWGGSRVWSSGQSFETDRNAAYASGTWGSGPTWQANANQVYGASRVYNSGESWEAAYNRVLPPASVVGLSNGAGGVPCDGVVRSNLAPVTLDRTGQWLVVWRYGPNGPGNLTGYIGGSAMAGCSGSVTTNPSGVYWQGSATAGQVASCTLNCNAGGTTSVYVNAYFIPTQGNPH